ncbi:MAG TPA: FG-GAP-like repeat-containing protein, partial [Mucilaginibacter sp.]|nr:FG-GAP-like repeat-containing protein [Mucilaginibacter sp.]
MLKPYLITIALFIATLGNLFAQAPVISSFSPANGPVGTIVTVSGSNYNTTPSANIVFFGATKANVISAAAGKLTVSVPVGATYQPISILNTATALSGYSKVPFLVTFPSKNSISAADFDAPQSFSSGGGTYEGAIADLDGDGKTDVITVDDVEGDIAVFRNISPTTGAVTTASFAARINLHTAGDPQHIVIADLNGDGLSDIIATNQNSNKISVMVNTSTTGNISFAPHADMTIGTDVDVSAINFISIADVDADGRPDMILITNSEIEKNITIIKGDGTELDFQGGTGFTSLSVGDIDNDGLPDIIVTEKGLTIYHNTTAGGVINFTPIPSIVKSTVPVTASLGDVDNDGKLDIIEGNPVTNSDPSNASISIYRNLSTPGNISLANNVDFACRATDRYILFNDMDGDGKGDIILGTGVPIQILRNTTAGGNISMTAPINITTNLSPQWLGIGDINGDGKPDLVATDIVTNAFDVYQNDPQSTIVIQPPVISSFTPKTAIVGATVTVNGSNFNTNTAGNIVFFGAARGTVLTASATQLTVKVPTGATYQPIAVTNTAKNLTCYSNSAFFPTFQAGSKPTNFDAK